MLQCMYPNVAPSFSLWCARAQIDQAHCSVLVISLVDSDDELHQILHVHRIDKLNDLAVQRERDAVRSQPAVTKRVEPIFVDSIIRKIGRILDERIDCVIFHC